ncbi:hypothetical protein [Rubritalea tangerina]|uniref:hypothetical protein n=1 Tax=Rubritalea tangerina TaxID=430798 RepID=UPI0036101E83
MPTNSIAIGTQFMQKSGRFNNLPKAYAALKSSTSLGNDYDKKYSARLLERLIKKMTPTAIEEGEELHDNGYPFAEEYRLEALKHLIEVGDIPKDTQLDTSTSH